MAEAKKKTVRIHLFKDNGRYKDDVFVGVNGVNYKIQRGVDVDVPPEVAEVLERWRRRRWRSWRQRLPQPSSKKTR